MVSAASYPKPFNEGYRLSVLDSYDVLDSEAETQFDRAVRLAAEHFRVPIALVSLVDECRQWFKAQVGLNSSETPREMAFCAHALVRDEPMVVLNALEDPRFAANPLVTGAPHIRFYAGAPLAVPEGVSLGTLCIIDIAPRPHFSEADVRYLADLAAMVVDALVSRRMRLAETGDLRRSLTQATRAAGAAEQAKAEFLALTGHELRTPLNAILGFARLIEQECYGPVGHPSYAEYGRLIVSGGERLLQTVSKMLEFAQSETGSVKLDESRFAVDDLIAPCIDQMRGEAAHRAVALHVQMEQAGLMLTADRLHSEQMLLQLLSNAIKNAPEGSRVAVSAGSDAQGLWIAVEDEGEGIAPEALEHAMEVFRQTDMRIERAHEGIGLGLPLTERLIELHGGRLEIGPLGGAGTRAALRFPAYRMEASDGAARAVAS